jgi:hypothetical protein
MAFFEMMAEWRESGDFAGLEVRRAPAAAVTA